MKWQLPGSRDANTPCHFCGDSTVWFADSGCASMEVSYAPDRDAEKPYYYWAAAGGTDLSEGRKDSLADAQRACIDAVITYGQSLVVGATKLRDPDDRSPIRIRVRRGGSHLHLQVFMGGLCGRLVIGVDDEKMFRALVRADWQED